MISEPSSGFCRGRLVRPTLVRGFTVLVIWGLVLEFIWKFWSFGALRFALLRFRGLGFRTTVYTICGFGFHAFGCFDVL